MFSFSRRELQRQLISDQALWSRLSVAAAALLWPAEVLALGWATGWWAGGLTALLLDILSVVLPRRLGTNLYLLDLMDRVARLPLGLAYLLIAWHLWLREPVLPVLGQPLAGGLLMAFALWLVSRTLAFVIRLAARWAFPAGSDRG